MRKFDRAYKTFDQVEQRVFEEFMNQEQIDPNDFLKALQRQEEDRHAQDMAEGERQAQIGKI
jgi:hypothetical protein